jgi:hypothetical protein
MSAKVPMHRSKSGRAWGSPGSQQPEPYSLQNVIASVSAAGMLMGQGPSLGCVSGYLRFAS